MIAAQLTIVCDWCLRPILTMPHWSGRTRMPLDQIPAATDALEAELAAKDLGAPIGAPPGDRRHLCTQCISRGTPPATNEGHQARRNAEKAAARAAKKKARVA